MFFTFVSSILWYFLVLRNSSDIFRYLNSPTPIFNLLVFYNKNREHLLAVSVIAICKISVTITSLNLLFWRLQCNDLLDRSTMIKLHLLFSWISLLTATHFCHNFAECSADDTALGWFQSQLSDSFKSLPVFALPQATRPFGFGFHQNHCIDMCVWSASLFWQQHWHTNCRNSAICCQDRDFNPFSRPASLAPWMDLFFISEPLNCLELSSS